MSDLVERAKDFAIHAHKRIFHARKYSLQPYDVHLRGVAELVASVCDDPEIIAAAWLHDTVEDTPATFPEIERAFGPAVMRLVEELTDVSKPSDGNRAARKAIDRRHTAQASPRAKTIKLADLIDNCKDIFKHDVRFGRVYLDEMAALLDVLTEGDATLLRQARALVETCRKRLAKAPVAALEEAFDVDALPLEMQFTQQRGLRLFTEAFTARDILEPLLSFDEGARVVEVRRICVERGVGVAGVRRQGGVIGYVCTGELAGRFLGACVRPLAGQQVLEMDASLSDVIQVLTRFDFCFVTLSGEVVAVIGRGDIEKPIVRMWLFGMVTVMEMSFVRMVRTFWPNGEWVAFVSPPRLEKARLLFAERQRRGHSCDLLDCLQFSDKAQILIEEPRILADLNLQSKNTAKRIVKELESLRNNLAHGQGIVEHDWPQIARMTQRMELLYGHI